MKPQRGLDVFRTSGDTDAVVFVLTYVDDTGTVVVPNTATVRLNILSASAIRITGTSDNGGTGKFSFAAATLPTAAGRYDYDIDFNDGTSLRTLCSGKLVIYAKV